MARQPPSSSSSISYGFTYQVFLSFRGTDTRHGFTGNLYKALIDKGIHTFIDDNDLQRGDEITPSLVKAIEESRIFIPVFSINYASSSFCLDELVHIIKCYKTKGRLVLPVFFGVEPTNVRHQTGSYGEALAEHEKRFQNDKNNMERLQRWKVALSQAANLSGYDDSPPRYEYKFIGEIVKNISNKISRQPLHVANYPVGLQSRVQKVKSLLDEGPDDGVHMVGIYGIGGLGKSTLARAIYNFVADQFEGLCFLHDVRENSAQNDLKHLQEKLLLKTTGLKIKSDHVFEGIPIIKERLCRKKILLILDDVDDMKQLHALAGGPDWFGRGSRVIITTRDKHLLTSHDIERKYAVEELCGTEALELLRWMAFKNNKVPSIYEDVLNRAVSYASGLPLVLEIVGSNLFGKSINEWKGTLDGYEKIPNKKIHEILKVSYDALEEEQQSVFLDITCCFKGCKWEEFEDILRIHYGHSITHHLAVLAEKSLVKISTSTHSGSIYDVRLHDLIKDMGKEVVRQESPKEPGERSRLWRQEDIVHVLKENTGTSKIEMMYMNFPSMESVIDKKGKAFKKMTKLKTLIIKNGHFSKGLKYLPSSLRVLKWKRCLSKSIPSNILSKKFQNMKVLIFDQCEYLTHISDVSCLQNLEKLSFEYCANLITIHNSIGHLNKLEILNASGCSKLEHFPPLQLPCLKKFDISVCWSLKNFPELLCEMTNIKDINIDYTPIEELPYSFQNFSELQRLTIYGGGKLRFPKYNDKMNSIVLSNVEHLDLTCTNLTEECLPILLKWFVNVTFLDLSDNNNFTILPECLSECHHLKHLYLMYCKALEEIRGIPPNLERLFAGECNSLSSSSIRMLMSQKLHESGCTHFLFPNTTERIPDWFEHQSRGDTISFWYHKELPSISFTFIIICQHHYMFPTVQFFVNGYEKEIGCDRSTGEFSELVDDETSLDGHTTLLHIKLEEDNELGERLWKNEWIHVEFKLWFDEEENDTLMSGQMGIHVWKEKSNTEGGVRFTNPYSKRKKFLRMPKKQREEILHRRSLEKTKSDEGKSLEVSEAENLQQQDLAILSSGMHNLVLTETKEMHRFVEMGVSETETVQRCSLEETMSDEDKSLEVSETETVDVILSFAQMGIHEKSNTEEDEILNNHNSRKTWGTFLSLGASKSNTEGDENEILNNAQDKRKMWGTFTNPYSRKRKFDEYLNASLSQFQPEEVEGFSDTEGDEIEILSSPQDEINTSGTFLFFEQVSGTFLGLGASKRNTDGDEIEILSSAQDERNISGTFLGFGASKSNTDGDEIEILSSSQDERKMWGAFLALGPS